MTWSIRPFVLALTAVTLLSAQGAAGVAFAQGAPDAQEFIVRFREGTAPAVRGAAAAGAGAAVQRVYRHVAAISVRVPGDQALRALQQNPSVLSIVPNRRVFASQHALVTRGKPGGGTPAPPPQSIPAGVQRVGVPVTGSNGAGIGVAVLDTGVDLTHADLTGTVDGFSAFGGSCQDDDGHGTHVAGIIGARNNSIDVVGVAAAAGLYCVKVLDGTGNGSDATVMAGLEWVLDVKDTVSPAIRVVNMSLGRPGSVDDNPALRDLIASLDAAGVTIVVAAGNDPAEDVADQIPAAYPQVISVASTTAAAGTNQCRALASPIGADVASHFTTDGTSVTVSAPGEQQEDVSRACLIKSIGILSTALGGGTTRMSGTSMASPHVAGIAARYFQQHPAVTPADVRNWIVTDAARRGQAPVDSPAASYTFDGVREGIAHGPSAP